MIKTGTDIALAAHYIRQGELVALPTETVYGLGANALDAIAVAKIFEAKQRPTFDPLIVHIADMEMLGKLFLSPIDPLVFTLAKAFWPGPLTIVFKKTDLVPDLVTSGLDTVGVRMPSHPMALELIRTSGCPIAAPSANLFSQLSPTRPEHVQKQLTNVAYLLDGGSTNVGIESTIVAVENGETEMLRPGIITPEEIALVTGKMPLAHGQSNKIVAPGLLKHHYSPRKPLYFTDSGIKDHKHKGLIKWTFNNAEIDWVRTIVLSEKMNLVEAAANLFGALHAMEEDERVEVIYADKLPLEGIGIAIMDRLTKAAYQYNV